MASNPLEYFAAVGSEDVGQRLVERLQTLGNKEQFTELNEMYQTAYMHAYGQDFGLGTTYAVQREGKKGELAKVRVNNARANGKALLSILLGPKVVWRPQAVNVNVDARAAAQNGAKTLEYFWKDRSLADFVFAWAEGTIWFSEMFMFPEWDPSRGAPLAPIPGGGLQLKGDLTFHNVLPWDIIRDPRYPSFDKLPWLACRIWKNKYELANLFPKDVLGKPTEDKILGGGTGQPNIWNGALANPESDLVPLTYFFHRPTGAKRMEQGRETIFLNQDCVLRDSVLKTYDDIPLHRLAGSEMFGTAYAYTEFWDMLGIQEVMDGIHSAVTTNILTNAVQSIAVEEGTREDIDKTHGMRLFYYKPTGKPPMPLQMTKSPPEAFAYLKELRQQQQLMVALNDTARGQPETAQMNAQAFALLAAMAIQQNTPFQSRYLTALSKLGASVLSTLARNMPDDMAIAISGKADEYLYKEQKVSRQELGAVKRVLIEVGNPMEQTAAGRFTLAQMYVQLGLAQTKEDLQQVLDTGRMEPATNAIRDELMLVEWENEQIRGGEVPTPHFMHNHPLHAQKHAALLSDPLVLQDPRLVQAVQQHIDLHYQEFYGVPPNGDPAAQPGDPAGMGDPQMPIRMRLLLGQPPPMGAGPPPGPPGAPGGPPPGGPPGAGMLEPPSPFEQAGPLPSMPPMPNNPLSGQRFNPVNGGMPGGVGG